ncbi:exostosin family protein [Brevundimonas sp.]|uniref:exostosin domain-containing protein n=1 Tax=Brevundimonas sp. TaxID=1871086 RepID=UPI0025F456DD|nr:exostosin family protein [Brevundimonas sp.]
MLEYRHDGDWQYPAITEQRAFEMVRASGLKAEGVGYFAFPWATLIDRLGSRPEDAADLLAQLDAFAATAKRRVRRVTTCQHVRMQEFKHLFDLVGITDVFWSHAARGRPRWTGNRAIRIHPFPLYPVQAPRAREHEEDETRPILFNFIGAVQNTWYLTDVRRWIADHLQRDPRGLVVLRDRWHYQRAVYDHQIRRLEVDPQALTDAEAEAQFKRALRRSTFTLCPSGAGPSSIRLWEALGFGSIPVLLSDTAALPGPAALWAEAAVACDETEDAVKVLPDRLAELASDPAAIARKRRALRQLWSLYGPGNFIHDIRALAVEASQAAVRPRPAAAPATIRNRPRVCLFGRHGHRTPLSYPAYRQLFAGRFDYVDSPREADLVVVGFEIDIRDNFDAVWDLHQRSNRPVLAVVSEEPLWDTVWSTDLFRAESMMTRGGRRLPFRRLNHTNGDAFEFEVIPYFLTTDDLYFVRYGHVFARNARKAPQHYAQLWSRAPIRAAFMAEHRDKKVYDVQPPQTDVRGLSAYRTRLAQLCDGPGVLRDGKGWDGSDLRRQDLPDWHLDKLSRLDGRSFMVSAIENTHQRQYVTEKLFDALACQAAPIYFAGECHRALKLAGGAMLNVHGLTPSEAAEKVMGFQPTLEFLDAYVSTQQRLADLFRRPRLLADERQRVTSRVSEHLMQWLDARPLASTAAAE